MKSTPHYYNAPNDRLNTPRERHYTIAHVAFRQICQTDSHYFFNIMASAERDAFLTQLLARVATLCPQDSSEFEASSFEVMPSRILNHPLLLIKMPAVKAYVEAIYVGVVSMIDMTVSLEGQAASCRYYTLEMGEGEQGECYFFCEWQDDQHLNLAELEAPCTLQEFALLISRHIEQGEDCSK